MRLQVVVNFSRARAFMDKLVHGHQAPTTWSIARAIYYQYVLDNFREQGRPDKWPKLSPATIARRRKGKFKHGSAKILQDTGILRNSATSPTGGGYTRTTPHAMEVGTKIPYAGYHHTGTRNMPMRRFYTYDNPLLRRMAAAMQSAALAAARR